MDVSSIEDPNEILKVYSERVKSYVVDYEGNTVEKDAKGNVLVAEKVNVAKILNFRRKSVCILYFRP